MEGVGGERTIDMPISTEGSGMPTMRPKAGSPVWGGGGGTIDIPISTEGSGMPTKRPKAGSPVWCGGRELFTCPYPL